MKIEEVFRQTGFPEYTYAERKKYDSVFRSALKDGGVHVYLYGYSKSGKTCMWKNYLSEGEYIEIKITSEMNLDSFYHELLDGINTFYLKNYSEQNDSAATVGVDVKAKIASFFSAGGKVENTDSNSKALQYERISSPKIGLTFVTQKAKEAKKTIILEDFQMASLSFIEELASVLKAFADDQIKVIIVGIDNRISDIVNARNDISARINTINLDRFKKEELIDIISKGEKALNIEFSDEIKKFIINNSYERAYILQGICRYLCQVEDIVETQRNKKIITDKSKAEEACLLLATSYECTYEKSFLNILRAATKANKNDTYRWILKVFRNGLKIGDGGIEAKVIAGEIKKLSPSFTAGSLYPCLKNVIVKQETPIFKYEGKSLFVNDIMFIFFLRWSDTVKENLYAEE